MADEEKLGYHKGALESLLNEKIELVRLLQIVDSLIKKHSHSLEKMGVDVDEFIENVRKRRVENIRNNKRRDTDSEG